jgi:NADH-quinone oxidoreductase subunit A
MVAVSAVLGERHRERTTDEPYESGISPTGSARIRFDVKFYLMAMFFVIFDLEAVFVYAWAANARLLGWGGYAEIVVFIGFLVLALFYLWRVGAIEWGPARHRRFGKTPARRSGASSTSWRQPGSEGGCRVSGKGSRHESRQGYS